MPKYREEKNFLRDNIYLIFIVGTVSILLIAIFVISYIKNSKEYSIRKQNDDTISLIKSADDKFQQARNLVDENASDSANQEKAKKLLQESVNDAKKATELQPDNPRTWLLLGEIYNKLRDVNPQTASLAEEAYNQVISLNPNIDEAYEKLATIHISVKKYKDAEKELLMAIKLNNKEANYHYKLGNVYKELGNKEKARGSYLVAKKLTPDENKLALAQIDVQLKNLEKPATASAKTASGSAKISPTQKLQPTIKTTSKPTIKTTPTPTPKPTQPLIKLGI